MWALDNRTPYEAERGWLLDVDGAKALPGARHAATDSHHPPFVANPTEQSHHSQVTKDLVPNSPATTSLTDHHPDEHPAEKKPGSVRKIFGEAVNFVGDAAKATLGDKAEDLRKRLKGYAHRINGDEAPTPRQAPFSLTAQSLPQRELIWLSFCERVDVTLHLTHLVVEVMSPPGWSHLLRLPLEKANELHRLLAPILNGEAGWKRTISRCEGFLADLESAASQIGRLDNRPDARPEDRTAGVNNQAKNILGEARSALLDLQKELGLLLKAARSYEDSLDASDE